MKPGRCIVCNSPAKDEIEAGLAIGTPYRDISSRFGVAISALSRHKTKHPSVALSLVHEATSLERDHDAISHTRRLLRVLQDAEAVYERVVAEGGSFNQVNDALTSRRLAAVAYGAAVAERDRVALANKPAAAVDLQKSREFVELQTRLLHALQAYPEARLAVSKVIGTEENALTTELGKALNAANLAAALGLELEPWQEVALESTHSKALWNVSRQGGKSTIAALLALHRALYVPKSLVLLVSSLRQSTELFRKALGFYQQLGKPVPSTAENALSLELENGSRIVCLPGKEGTIRGYSAVNLIVVDEAPHVPDPTLIALLPMLMVSSGRILALGTPAGKRGWWWEAWSQDQSWEHVLVTAYECPHITPDRLEELRGTLSERDFGQEFMGVFAESVGAAFEEEMIRNAFSRDVEALKIAL